MIESALILFAIAFSFCSVICLALAGKKVRRWEPWLFAALGSSILVAWGYALYSWL